MTQTTAAIPKNKFQVMLSTDGSSFTDKGGAAVSVSHTGEEQQSGSQNTADGSAPVVTAGNKHGPATITLRGLYTKTSAEFWDYIRDRWEGTSKTIYVRWAPEGGIGTVVGNEQFTAADDAGSPFACVIKSCVTPELDAGDGSPAMVSAVLEAPKVLRGTTTT